MSENEETQEPSAVESECSAGLGVAEFEIRCAGEPVAWAIGKREDAWREAEHYAFIYGQDGPVEVFEVFKTYTRMDYTRRCAMPG